jgi:hypothetical protein
VRVPEASASFSVSENSPGMVLPRYLAWSTLVGTLHCSKPSSTMPRNAWEKRIGNVGEAGVGKTVTIL